MAPRYPGPCTRRTWLARRAAPLKRPWPARLRRSYFSRGRTTRRDEHRDGQNPREQAAKSPTGSGGRRRSCDFREVKPRLDYRIRVEGHGFYASLHQPLREIRIVAGALAADAHVLVGLAARLDREVQHSLHRRVALVER